MKTNNVLQKIYNNLSRDSIDNMSPDALYRILYNYYNIIDSSDIKSQEQLTPACNACDSIKSCFFDDIPDAIMSNSLHQGGLMNNNLYFFTDLKEALATAIMDDKNVHANIINVNDITGIAIPFDSKEYIEKNFGINVIKTRKIRNKNIYEVMYELIDTNQETEKSKFKITTNFYKEKVTEELIDYISKKFPDKHINIYTSKNVVSDLHDTSTDTITFAFGCSLHDVHRTPYNRYNKRTMKYMYMPYSYIYTEKSVPIVDNDGFVFGEIIENSVYIFIKMESGYSYGQHNKVLFEIIDTVNMIYNEPDKYIERLNEMKNSVKNLKGFAVLCNTNKEYQIKSLTRRTEDSLKILNERKLSYTNALDEYTYNNNRLIDLTSGSIDESQYSEQYNQLLNNKLIERIEIHSDRLVIHTKTIFCRDTKTTILHLLGKYMISLYPDNKEVRWMNKERTINGWQAPHVFEGGNACLGNVSRVMPKLLAEGRMADAVTMALLFLESVNVSDSAGQNIRHWPQLSQEKVDSILESEGRKLMPVIKDESKRDAWSD